MEMNVEEKTGRWNLREESHWHFVTQLVTYECRAWAYESADQPVLWVLRLEASSSLIRYIHCTR